MKIIHRDLKLENILLNNNLDAKISDFGFAKFINSIENSQAGTPLTMAPEVHNNLPYNEKCDIWSLGIIIYQILYGKIPFKTDNLEKLR